MKRALMTVTIAACLVLAAGCSKGEADAARLPLIDASTERQAEVAAMQGAAPSVVLPDAPEEWGENAAQGYIDNGRSGPWRAFTPGVYDHESAASATLMGTWVLRAPEGDDRNGAVLVTAIMRPYNYEDPFTDEGSWGEDFVSAMRALRARYEIAESDISQFQPEQVGDYPAYLLTGFGEAGSNAGYNFAYLVFDDGAFFYEFRLAGDPRYFGDHQDAFLGFVAGVRFEG